MIEPLISAPNLNGLSHQDKIMKIEKNSLILILAKKADDNNVMTITHHSI